MSEHIISADDQGRLQFVYSDDLNFLSDLGRAETLRASNVEPTDDGRWTASIIGGPVLGPFNLRQDALRAEVNYLKENVL